MRKLLNTEKEFINKILKFKAEKNMEELQSAKLLREQLNCVALKWTIAPEKSLSLYYSQKAGNSAFYNIIDYLYFVKELEENQYITLLPHSNLKRDQERALYDKEKIGYSDSDKLDKDSLMTLLNSYNEEHFFYQKNGNAMFPIPRKEKFYIDIVDMLEKYATVIIYPLPLLNEYKDNRYKSLEEKYFNKQLNRAKIANAIAILAVLITSIFGLIQSCSSTSLDANQLNRIITSIENNKK
jgi:hypothetical protein